MEKPYIATKNKTKPTKDRIPKRPPIPATIKAPVEFGKTYPKKVAIWLITPISIKIAAIPPKLLLDSMVNLLSLAAIYCILIKG